jgi:hypothetical protein
MKYAFLLGVSLILVFPVLGLGAYVETSPDSSWEDSQPDVVELGDVLLPVEERDLLGCDETGQDDEVVIITDPVDEQLLCISGSCDDSEYVRVILDIVVPADTEGLDELREKVELIGQSQSGSFVGQQLLEDIINLCLCPDAQCQSCYVECPCCIPEPATVVLLGLGCLLTFRRRTF